MAKNFLLASLAGSLPPFHRFVPGPPKLLGGPCVGGDKGTSELIPKIGGKLGNEFIHQALVSVSTKR